MLRSESTADKYATERFCQNGSKLLQMKTAFRYIAEAASGHGILIWIIIIPSDWKNGNTVPIFTKGRKEDTGHNWPVSLTSLPGNTMEQILPEAILKHMEGRRWFETAAWFHQGQVPPDQPSDFLWWSDCSSGQGKSNGCHISGLL